MELNELERIQEDIADLRKAVQKTNPFLREVVEMRGYAIWSLIIGAGILVYCGLSQILVSARGGLESLPTWWVLLSWSILALFFLAGGVIKWLLIDRKARQIEKGANFGTAFKALYGGDWGQLNLPILIGMIALAFFAVWVGHPWYILSETAFFLGLACSSIVLAVDAKEYLPTGWYALLSSLVSLFFVETAPFLWLAIVWAGIFVVYGVSGLLRAQPDRSGENDKTGEEADR
jgi:hypothetical protein